MKGINKVILVGRLGADPSVNFTTTGMQATNFSIATTEVWKDKKTGEKKERTEWHRIVTWDKIAETCGKYLTKGRLVYIEGRLQTRSYVNKAEEKKWITEIVVQHIEFLDKATNSPKCPSEVPGPGDDDIPF
jgi:single-strand DNA-binding protein